MTQESVERARNSKVVRAQSDANSAVKARRGFSSLGLSSEILSNFFSMLVPELPFWDSAIMKRNRRWVQCGHVANCGIFKKNHGDYFSNFPMVDESKCVTMEILRRGMAS